MDGTLVECVIELDSIKHVSACAVAVTASAALVKLTIGTFLIGDSSDVKESCPPFDAVRDPSCTDISPLCFDGPIQISS